MFSSNRYAPRYDVVFELLPEKKSKPPFLFARGKDNVCNNEFPLVPYTKKSITSSILFYALFFSFEEESIVVE